MPLSSLSSTATRVLGAPGRWSVAGQTFALQVLIAVLVVAAGLAGAYGQAQRAGDQEAIARALAVAETMAATPDVVAGVRGPDPSAVLQPYAERVRVESGTDFVVVMSRDAIRYTHPDPTQIGKKFLGHTEAALAGGVVEEDYTGTLGPSSRVVVPVTDQGRVVALVSVGIRKSAVGERVRAQLPGLLLAGLVVALLSGLGTGLVSRRIRRQTHGLGEQQLREMYEYYDAVLHAVREGLLLVDTDHRVQLLNDEAKRLLSLDQGAVGRPVTELGFPESLTRTVLATDSRPDEIHLVDDAVLVVNTAPARWQGREVGRVVTLRDHTEIQAVAGELDTVRGLAESLRSQNHEAANRLHTVVSLVEMGRTEEALDFATEELEVAQLLTDRVVGSVTDPVVSALLLGKTAQAAERGVQLRIDDDTEVTDLPVEQRDAVTILGNLLDNALDAVSEAAERVVVVSLTASADAMRLRVSDSGAGLPAGLAEQVFERGWSTKSSDGPVGRGLGLALVVQAVRKYDGRIEVGTSSLGGARFDVRIGADR
jgi:sensor histidine kinase regulating citrate/malate metabolism